MFVIHIQVEKDELDEFEILEQYADDNASFLSNVSAVNRVVHNVKSHVRDTLLVKINKLPQLNI